MHKIDLDKIDLLQSKKGKLDFERREIKEALDKLDQILKGEKDE